jgi:hypothetical protein
MNGVMGWAQTKTKRNCIAKAAEPDIYTRFEWGNDFFS